jgi:hypothetical protein
VLGDTYTETFQQAKAVVSTLCVKATNISGETSYTELNVADGDTPNAILYFDCPKDTTSINLYPISTGDITIGSSSVTSGHESDTIEVSNGMAIPVTVTKDGSTTMQYKVIISYEDSQWLGDVDLSGHVDYLDLLAMKKHTLGISTLTDKMVSIGDYDSNGVIDIVDILYLKNFLLN